MSYKRLKLPRSCQVFRHQPDLVAIARHRLVVRAKAQLLFGPTNLSSNENPIPPVPCLLSHLLLLLLPHRSRSKFDTFSLLLVERQRDGVFSASRTGKGMVLGGKGKSADIVETLIAETQGSVATTTSTSTAVRSGGGGDFFLLDGFAMLVAKFSVDSPGCRDGTTKSSSSKSRRVGPGAVYNASLGASFPLNHPQM
jgi:hypothetical protein